MSKRAVYILLLLVFSACALGSDFASEVVSYKGLSGSGLYNDPYSVLGKPTTWIYDNWDELTFACSLVFGAYETDPNGNKLITTIADGAEIVVGFDHKVADDPGNPYGVDFIVFGNAAFLGDGWVGPNTNMEQYFLRSPTGIIAEPVMVSVAQGPNGPWFSFTSGPFGDTGFPTNAFRWDRDADDWGQQLNWLRPVDPNLSISDFDGLSAADAIDLYDGSAGGTGFDLKDLDSNNYEALAVDPDTGRKWIQYIKVEFLPGGSYAGEIDGFADVAGCGDYRHRFPVGDISEDCRVDYEDVELLCRYWLIEIKGVNDPAAIADVYEDGIVDFYDWAVIGADWLECNWQCE